MLGARRPSFVVFVVTVVLLATALPGCWWGRGGRYGHREERHEGYHHER
jgi:hypothetical protein